MIENIDEQSFLSWVHMGLALWPENTEEELIDEFRSILTSEKEKGFIYKLDDIYVGFINLSIRNEYVEGSNSSPVGYIEGVYVKPEFRKRNIAKNLVNYAEKWALNNGCSQIASDCELDNEISLSFHLGVGFTEANRIIGFIKDIKSSK